MVPSRTSLAVLAVLSLKSAAAFVSGYTLSRRHGGSATFLRMSERNSCENFANPKNDRRSFLATASSAAAASIFANVGFPEIASAKSKIDKINGNLASYGLPTIKKVPDGFSPLLEFFGRGKNRTPLLVNFAYPSDWVVTLPSNDVNGEDGTIQAGEYAKGDTATLFVDENGGKVDVATQGKDFFRNAIVKAISQKGDSIYQDFKIKKVVMGEGEYLKGQKYAICDYTYTLITGAGFEVDRQGVASVTSEGNGVQVLWTASTAIRYKKTEKQLRSIADSFRVYSEGLDLSSSRIEYLDDY